MLLAVPLLIMTLALLTAWGLGVLAKGRSVFIKRAIGAAGVAAVVLLPVGYDIATFEGSCTGLDGQAYACELAERINLSFNNGFAFTLPPALMWVLVYVMSLNTPR